MRVISEVVVEELDNLQRLVSLFMRLRALDDMLVVRDMPKLCMAHPTLLAASKSCENERTGGDGGRSVLYELTVEEGDLHQETRNMLRLGVLHDCVATSEAKPCFGSRMPYNPLDCVEDVMLHLDKGRLVVGFATDLGELVDGGHALLRVFELCSDPKGGAANELVVFGIHDSAGYITVDNVKGEVKSFGTEVEGEVDLDEEVNETGTHVPPDLGLLVHGGGGGHCTKLFGISRRVLARESEGKRVAGLTSISCMYLRMSNRYSSSNRRVSLAWDISWDSRIRWSSGMMADLHRAMEWGQWRGSCVPLQHHHCRQERDVPWGR